MLITDHLSVLTFVQRVTFNKLLTNTPINTALVPNKLTLKQNVRNTLKNYINFMNI